MDDDHGGFGIREAIAIAAVAVVISMAVIAGFEAAGFDTVASMRDQLGVSG